MNIFKSNVWHGLELIGDMMILDLLFILTSIPIFTTGPSLVALYRCFFRIIKGNQESVFSMYFKSFKESFVQAFISWLIILFFAFDVFLVLRYGYSQGLIQMWMKNPVFVIVASVIGLSFAFVLKNIFAIIAYFSCNLQQGFVNSIVFPCKHIGRTLLAILSTALILFAVWFLPFLITVAFSLSVFIDCKLFLPAFRKLAGFGNTRAEDKLENGLEEAW